MGLETVELIMAFEERFGIRIPDEDATELSTPRSVTLYIMGTAVGTMMSRDEVARIVREVIVQETGTTEFDEDSHFVNDLHID